MKNNVSGAIFSIILLTLILIAFHGIYEGEKDVPMQEQAEDYRIVKATYGDGRVEFTVEFCKDKVWYIAKNGVTIGEKGSILILNNQTDNVEDAKALLFYLREIDKRKQVIDYEVIDVDTQPIESKEEHPAKVEIQTPEQRNRGKRREK